MVDRSAFMDAVTRVGKKTGRIDLLLVVKGFPDSAPDSQVMSFPPVADAALTLCSYVLGEVGGMTPRQVLALFPVKKVYGRKTDGSKDYFHTMRMIRKHGMDTPIGDALAFLSEYCNDDIERFLVNSEAVSKRYREWQEGRDWVLDATSAYGLWAEKITDDGLYAVRYENGVRVTIPYFQ